MRRINSRAPKIAGTRVGAIDLRSSMGGNAQERVAALVGVIEDPFVPLALALGEIESFAPGIRLADALLDLLKASFAESLSPDTERTGCYAAHWSCSNCG